VTASIECELNRDASAVVTTIAGSGAYEIADGTGSQVMFRFPHGVTLDAIGNVFVSDHENQRIRKMTPVGGAWLIDVGACAVTAQTNISASCT
jgi:hypothetical protein